MMRSRIKVTPPPITPASRLWSEESGGSYRWQENSVGSLCPALFTASTHTFSPGSKCPTEPLRTKAWNSRGCLWLSWNTTLYPETTEDGAHQWTSTFSRSLLIGCSTRMRGAWGATLAPLTPGQRHPVLSEISKQGSWFSRQESYWQSCGSPRRTPVSERDSSGLGLMLSSSLKSLFMNVIRRRVTGEEVDAAWAGKMWGAEFRKRRKRFQYSDLMAVDRKDRSVPAYSKAELQNWKYTNPN